MAEIVSEIILKANSTEAVSSIKDLRDNVREYKGQLTQLERGTEEYNAVLNKLAQSQSELNQINRETQAATQNLTQIYGNISRVGAGVTSGFTALTSISALLGKENDRLAESLVKIQAGLQLTQSLYAVSNGFNSLSKLIIGFPQILQKVTTAFRAFNAVLLANPVVAIAAGVVALGAAIYGITNIIKNNNTNIDDLTSSYNALTKSIDNNNDALEREVVFLQAAGASEEELLLIRREANKQYIADLERALDEAYAKRVNANKRERKLLDEHIKNINSDLNKYYDIRQQINDTYTINDIKRETKANQDRLKAAKDAYNKQQAELEKQQKAEEDARVAFNNRILQIQIEASDRFNNALGGQERLDFINSEIETQKTLSNFFEKRSKEEGLTWEERNKALTNYYNALNLTIKLESEREQLQDQIRQAELDEAQAEEFRLQQQIELERQLENARNPNGETPEERIASLRSEADAMWERANDESLSYDERIDAIERYNQAQREADDLDARLAALKKRRQDQALRQGASTLNELSSLLGEETAAGKAAAIAAATISTFQAANSSYSALAGIPIVGPALGAAAAAVAIASGIANVKEILKVKTPGGDSGGNSNVSTPSLPSFPEMDTNFYEVHNTMDGYEEDLINQQRPVLVVESFNEVANRVQVAESQSAF